MEDISRTKHPIKSLQFFLTELHILNYSYTIISVLGLTAKGINVYILGIKNVYLFVLFFASKAKPAYIFCLLPNVL